MVVLRGILAGLVLGSLGSCWSPIFDAQVSLATVTSAQMTSEGQFSVNLDSNATTVAVPTPSRPPAEVFLASLQAGSVSLATETSSGGWVFAGYTSGSSYDTALGDPRLTTLVAGKDGTSVACFTPTVSGGIVSFVVGTTTTQYPTSTTSHVVGATAYPTTTDVVYYTLSTTSTGVSVDSFDSSSSVTLGSATTNIGTGTYSGSTAFGWLAYNPNKAVAYLTHGAPDGSGRYTTDQIQVTTTTITGITSWTRADRVVGFLTTGQLLTRDSEYFDLCDPGGAIQSSFPGGSLTFAGEFYDPGTGAYRCWFTEALANNGSNSSNGQTVRLYSIPTAQLTGLHS